MTLKWLALGALVFLAVFGSLLLLIGALTDFAGALLLAIAGGLALLAGWLVVNRFKRRQAASSRGLRQSA